MALPDFTQLKTINARNENFGASVYDDYFSIFDKNAGENRKVLGRFISPNNIRKQYLLKDDFVSATVFGEGLALTSSGGSVSAIAPWNNSGIGVIQATTGATATGRTGLMSSNTSLFRYGAARWYTSCLLRLKQLSTATDSYILRCGGSGDSISGEPIDGVYYRYTHTNTGGAFACVCRSNNVETVAYASSPVALAVDTDYRLETYSDATGTAIDFYINSGFVATINTNIPTAAGRETGFMPFSLIKTLGTVAANIQLDYFIALGEFNNQRGN